MPDNVTSQELRFTDSTNSTIDSGICSGFFCWYIICTNMNYKMMRVFSKRRSDVVLHTFYHCTGKTVYMYLTVFQRMWEIISSDRFDNGVTQDYDFPCLLWGLIFPRDSIGSIVTKFYRQLLLFGLILNWCTRTITTLILFTNFISRIAIYVCIYNIVTICVVANWPFVSFKVFITVFNPVISLIDLNEVDWENRYFLCSF